MQQMLSTWPLTLLSKSPVAGSCGNEVGWGGGGGDTLSITQNQALHSGARPTLELSAPNVLSSLSLPFLSEIGLVFHKIPSGCRLEPDCRNQGG